MAITGTPTIGDDLITITPTGSFAVDALAGLDTLRLDFSSLTSDVRHEFWSGATYRFTDDFLTAVYFTNFERFDLTMGSGDDVLVGADLNDRLIGGGGADLILSGLGADTIAGGAGVDRWSADYSTVTPGVNLTLLASGTATIGGTGALISGVEQISLTTGAGNDTINTEAYRGNDVLIAGSGDDFVALGRGVDYAIGGLGEDTLRMDWSGMTNPNRGITHGFWSGADYRYSNGVDQLTYSGFEKYHLIGGAGHDSLYGGNLNDRLVGNDGNDLLAGYQGIDVIRGGAGTDTWRVDTSNRGSLTVVDMNALTTNYGTSITGVEVIEYTGGNASDRVIANAGTYNDHISTGAGNDRVSTGRGADNAHGGDGTDRLVMNWSGITDVKHGISHGFWSGATYRYTSASGDSLYYSGFEIFYLTGGAGDDILFGGALKDTLIGNAGNDTLDSGIGDARINGGEGDDTWVADISAQGAAVFSAAKSQTTAQLVSLGMSVLGIERLSLTTGNGADKISTQGYALNDWVSTSGGNDTVNTGLGRDGANGGDGVDTLVIDYSSATSAVYNAFWSGAYYRYQMADGTSYVEWADFEQFRVTGGSGDDRLDGGALNDTLSGGAGDDILNGGGGTDSIIGGTGQDTYVGNYSARAGAVTLTLGANGAGIVTGPNTQLSGIENVNLTTGAGADVINLSAMIGNDTVNTGLGDDVINLGRGMRENANGGLGVDTFILDASLATSGLRMEFWSGDTYRLVSTDGNYAAYFGSMEVLNLTGGNGSDRMRGFDLGDTLSGGRGSDSLDGGAGDDILTGGADRDRFDFRDLSNAGRDRITDASSGDLIVLHGLTTVGSVMTGNGAAATTGQVYVSSSGGNSTLHIGLDATAGADLRIDLTGTFVAADFSLSGSDIFIL